MSSIPETSTEPPKLSDAFRSHPFHLRHEYPDLTSLRELPDSYDWTDQHYVVSATNGDFAVYEPVPVIDLKDPNAQELIGRACKTWGAFQVINHGIPTSLLDHAECITRDLFSLPVEQKLKASRSPDAFTGYGLARSNSFFSKVMWSEVFTIIGSPLDHFRQLWSQDYTERSDVMEEYEEEMKKLATKLMWLMLASLNITKEDIEWADRKGEIPDGSAVLQLNYYPACPDPDRAMGMAAHTDSTILTIIYQSNTSGLQVLNEGTSWVTVPAIPGGLVVNVGDLLHILSNGYYISALHRALVNRDKARFSIPYFYGPPPEAKVSPLPKLVSPKDPPRYRAVNWSEFLGIKAKHFNNGLSSIRICTSQTDLVAANGDDSNAEVA